MAYGGHKIFYTIWRLFITLSIVGIVFYLGKFLSTRRKLFHFRDIKNKFCTLIRKSRKTNKQTEQIQNFPHIKILLLSLLAIIAQILGLWSFYGTSDILVQGRHLFPLIVPIAVVFIIGVKSFFDMFHKKGGEIAVVAFFLFAFLFFNFALWNYIVPIFHLTLKGPHV